MQKILRLLTCHLLPCLDEAEYRILLPWNGIGADGNPDFVALFFAPPIRV